LVIQRGLFLYEYCAVENTINRFTVTINARFVLFYIVLFLLFTQLHELSHIVYGRVVCGCYGTQLDFNTWTLYGSCFEYNPFGFLPSLAGPAFSFAGIWTGVYLLRTNRKPAMWWGFLLVLVNKPFARFFTVLIKGGDELNAARKLWSGELPDTYIWIITLLVIFFLTVPPLYYCYIKLQNKKRLLIVISFCILPMIFQYMYEFRLLNWLLQKGIGAANPFMGIANLIHIHTLLMLLISLGLYRSMQRSQPAWKQANG
jgi:hypothetical protein